MKNNFAKFDIIHILKKKSFSNYIANQALEIKSKII